MKRKLKISTSEKKVGKIHKQDSGKSRVKRGIAAKKAQQVAKPAKTKKIVKLTEEQIAQLVIDHRENGRKLSRSILRKWRVRMPCEEIDSLVDLALCETAKRFSPQHGASFMTFFFYHLRGHLVRAVARAAQNSNMFVLHRQSDGIDTREWNFNLNEGAWNVAPEYQGKEVETPENLMIRKEKMDVCRNAMSKLDELERIIIDRSFGDDEALVDIARSLGYSRCHISRVKKNAIDRVRNLLGYQPQDDSENEEQVSHKEVITNRPRYRTVSDRIKRRRGRRGATTVCNIRKLEGELKEIA